MTRGLRILKIGVWVYFILGFFSTIIVVLTGGYEGKQIIGIFTVFIGFLFISSIVFYYFIKTLLKHRN